MPERTLNNEKNALLALIKSLKTHHYEFKTISPLSHLRVNTRQDHPRARPDDKAKPESRLQNLRDIFGWSRRFKPEDIAADIYQIMQHANVVKSVKDDFYSSVRVSSYCYYPNATSLALGINTGHQEQALLFVHSAYPTTANDSVFFGPDTYRYLNLIDRVIRQRDASITKRMVDIGCGAGPGAILMALQFTAAEVFATDINQAALELAEVNAHAAGALNVKTCISDILTGVDDQFDVITANPPFLVDKDKRAYRHGGGDLGAELSFRMLQAAIPRLNPGGQFILYTGVAISDGVDVFKRDVTAYLHAQAPNLSWQYQELDPDIFGEELFNDVYAGADRIAAISLIVTLNN